LGKVDDGGSRSQLLLFREWLAVVGGDTGIRSTGFNGAVGIQQWAAISHTWVNALPVVHYSVNAFSVNAQADFFNRADAWDSRERPSAAISHAQSRSPSTSPYMRVAAR
jgi:hypothetical protein